MKQQPLVSILINNYNKQNYCKQALKSAINQNYKNLEVIFYDDNSNDNSLKNIIELKNKSKGKIKMKILRVNVAGLHLMDINLWELQLTQLLLEILK